MDLLQPFATKVEMTEIGIEVEIVNMIEVVATEIAPHLHHAEVEDGIEIGIVKVTDHQVMIVEAEVEVEDHAKNDQDDLLHHLTGKL